MCYSERYNIRHGCASRTSVESRVRGPSRPSRRHEVSIVSPYKTHSSADIQCPSNQLLSVQSISSYYIVCYGRISTTMVPLYKLPQYNIPSFRQTSARRFPDSSARPSSTMVRPGNAVKDNCCSSVKAPDRPFPPSVEVQLLYAKLLPYIGLFCTTKESKRKTKYTHFRGENIL